MGAADVAVQDVGVAQHHLQVALARHLGSGNEIPGGAQDPSSSGVEQIIKGEAVELGGFPCFIPVGAQRRGRKWVGFTLPPARPPGLSRLPGSPFEPFAGAAEFVEVGAGLSDNVTTQKNMPPCGKNANLDRIADFAGKVVAAGGGDVEPSLRACFGRITRSVRGACRRRFLKGSMASVEFFERYVADAGGMRHGFPLGCKRF